MSAPNSSFEMDSLAEKTEPIDGDTVLGKDSANANLLVEIPVASLGAQFTWAASDEDSPFSTGLQYTTEATSKNRSFTAVSLSVKNAPTGSSITVDILKETGQNTNIFASIFSTLPVIDLNEFTSETSAVTPVFSVNTWELGRRLQLVLTINDSNSAATGLKVQVF